MSVYSDHMCCFILIPATCKLIQILNLIFSGKNIHIWGCIHYTNLKCLLCSRYACMLCQKKKKEPAWWEVGKVRWERRELNTFFFLFFEMQSCPDVTVLKYLSVAQPVWSCQRAHTLRFLLVRDDHGDVQEFHRRMSFPNSARREGRLFN